MLKLGKNLSGMILAPTEFAASYEPGVINPDGMSPLILYVTVPSPPMFASTAVNSNSLNSNSSELYPSPVDPIPILTPSIRTLSPTANGNVDPELNPVSIPIVTSLETVLNPTVLIPTPLLFDVGIILGRTPLILKEFLKMVTLESPME